jgi:hypothetical protein
VPKTTKAADDLTKLVQDLLTKAAADKLTTAQTAAKVVQRLRSTGRTSDTAEVRAAYARIMDAVRAVEKVPGPADRAGLGDLWLELWEATFGLDALKALQARIARRIAEGGW